MLKVAVIGAGLIGRKHIATVQDLPCFDLAAIVNPESPSDTLAKASGAKRFFSHTEMLENTPVDCAVIASATPSHCQIAVDLLDRGIPVLIEKPIAETVQQGLEIEAAARRTGVPALIGHHRRHNPVLQQFRDVIMEESLGKLIAFSGIWSVYKPTPYYDVEWRVGSGGGPVLINLIHEIDNLQAMLGPITTVAVIDGTRRRDHNTEEAFSASFGFSNGVVGSVVLSDSAASPWSWEQSTGENSALFPKNAENPYRFMFEGGAIEFPGLQTWRQSPPDWTTHISQSEPYDARHAEIDVFTAQLEHFAEVAQGKVDPKVTIRDGVQSLHVAEIVKGLLVRGGGFTGVDILGWID